MIRSLAGEFPIKALCRALGVSRSGYYAAQRKAERPRAQDNVRLGAKIKESFEASQRTYGSPRLAVVLRRAGERCGRHRVARLNRAHAQRSNVQLQPADAETGGYTHLWTKDAKEICLRFAASQLGVRRKVRLKQSKADIERDFFEHLDWALQELGKAQDQR